MLQPRSLPTGANGADLQEQRASPISANTEPTIARLLHNPQLAFLAEPAFTFTSSTIELSQQHVSRHGVMEAFVNTCQRWNLSDREELTLLGYADNPFLGNQILDSRMLATPQDAKDRAAYVLAISVGLGAVFNEVIDAERKWLNLPNGNLNDKTPLAFMLEGRMANIVTVLRLVEQERGLD
jgi:Antitoxin Xre/MbcA/ParS C-terminal toxin-binding domain